MIYGGCRMNFAILFPLKERVSFLWCYLGLLNRENNGQYHERQLDPCGCNLHTVFSIVFFLYCLPLYTYKGFKIAIWENILKNYLISYFMIFFLRRRTPPFQQSWNWYKNQRVRIFLFRKFAILILRIRVRIQNFWETLDPDPVPLIINMDPQLWFRYRHLI